MAFLTVLLFFSCTSKRSGISQSQSRTNIAFTCLKLRPRRTSWLSFPGPTFQCPSHWDALGACLPLVTPPSPGGFQWYPNYFYPQNFWVAPGKFRCLTSFLQLLTCVPLFKMHFFGKLETVRSYTALRRELDALEKQLAAAATCGAASEEGLWEAFASWEHSCNVLGS